MDASSEYRSGVERVRAVIARLSEDPGWADRQPVAADVLADLQARTPALPTSLLEWLAFDARSPGGEVMLVEEGRLLVKSAADLFEELVVSESEGEEWEEGTRQAMQELAAELPGEVLALREPCGEDHFLYLGRWTDRGEPAVIAMKHEQLRVAWSGFDVYVAEVAASMALDAPTEEAARSRAEQLILGSLVGETARGP